MSAKPAVGPGDRVPNFDLPAGAGRVSRKGLRGRTFVLYFYPKDDTAGCTKEALDFTAERASFDAIGVPVIGVSRDPLAKHEKFRAKHGLEVELASDEEGTVSERFGVWVEKSMYGRRYMGIERSTFLVGADGKILHAWRKVKVPGHADEVLARAREAAG